MTRLSRKECPNTRAEFIKKFNSDRIFRSRAENMGFTVIGENVIFPDGKMVANKHIK